MPPWSNRLCNLYVMLRFRRSFDLAARRKYYRRIHKEKRRIIEEFGVHEEEVRLLCRWMANPANRAAEMRYKSFSGQLRLPF